MVRVEFDARQIDEAPIVNRLKKEGLTITDTAVEAGTYLRGIKETEKPAKEHTHDKEPGHEEKGEEHEHAHGGLLG